MPGGVVATHNARETFCDKARDRMELDHKFAPTWTHDPPAPLLPDVLCPPKQTHATRATTTTASGCGCVDAHMADLTSVYPVSPSTASAPTSPVSDASPMSAGSEAESDCDDDDNDSDNESTSSSLVFEWTPLHNNNTTTARTTTHDGGGAVDVDVDVKTDPLLLGGKHLMQHNIQLLRSHGHSLDPYELVPEWRTLPAGLYLVEENMRQSKAVTKHGVAAYFLSHRELVLRQKTPFDMLRTYVALADLYACQWRYTASNRPTLEDRCRHLASWFMRLYEHDTFCSYPFWVNADGVEIAMFQATDADNNPCVSYNQVLRDLVEANFVPKINDNDHAKAHQGAPLTYIDNWFQDADGTLSLTPSMRYTTPTRTVSSSTTTASSSKRVTPTVPLSSINAFFA